MHRTRKKASSMIDWATKLKRSVRSSAASNSLLLNVKKTKKSVSPVDVKIDPETAPTDHYLLQEIKGDEDENEIAFVLTENIFENANGPPAECREEIQIDELLAGDEKDDNVSTKEIVEHVCGKCYKSFRTIKVLKRHMDYCIFNSEMVVRRAEMQKNIEKIEKEAIIMEKKDVCFCCGDSYDTCHGGHINCTECPKTFKTQLSLERHIFLIHSENNDFPCTVCNARIRTESLLKLHIEQHKNRGKPFACKTCGKDFTRQYHLKRHHKFSQCGGGEEAEIILCKVCGKEFYRLDNLRVHLKSHLGQGTPKKAEYTCPCCKKCFYSLSTLNIHIRTHTGERPFDCDLCEKNFPSLVSLKKHRRYHTGEKPYSCEVCHQNFAVKEVLNRHMKRHTGQKPHACNQCQKRFIQATQLKNHLRTHLRPFECALCPEKFKTEKQFERHFKCHKKENHTSTQSFSKYRCTDCKVEMKTQSALRVHEQSTKHIEKSTKVCPQCGDKHPNMKALEFHILKEHEATDVQCVHCDMVFGQHHLLEHHMKTAHITSTSVGNETHVQDEQVKKEQDNCVILEEFLVDSFATETEVEQGSTKQVFTVIAKDNEVSPEFAIVEKVTKMNPPDIRAELKKSIAKCLRDTSKSDDDVQITENVNKLLDMLVDVETLVKFGWPDDTVENVLCKVIENCGYNLQKSKFTEDYSTRMREYVKLLFTVVIQNNSIKELLNNYTIDEVIEFVLSNEDDD